jgi:hypothetical protein
LLQRDLERPRIDRHEQLSLLDDLSFAEQHLRDLAGDLRPHGHRDDRRHRAERVEDDGQVGARGGGDADRARRAAATATTAAAGSACAGDAAAGARCSRCRAAARCLGWAMGQIPGQRREGGARQQGHRRAEPAPTRPPSERIRRRRRRRGSIGGVGHGVCSWSAGKPIKTACLPLHGAINGNRNVNRRRKSNRGAAPFSTDRREWQTRC